MRRCFVVVGIAGVAAACARPVAPAPVDLAVPALPAAKGALYTLPSCPLHYEVLVRELSSMDGELQFDTERFESLDATVAPGHRMQLAGEVVGRSIHDGVRSHGNPTSDYAPPLLETDGWSWTEREGPTWLFSDVGAQGGLAWFFPTLPKKTERGATAKWDVPFNSGQTTASLEVERKRGRHPVMSPPDEKEIVYPTTFTPAEVRFEGAHVESGVSVFEYTMTGEYTDHSPTDEPFVSSTTKTYRGTYAVIANGRVLRAHVEMKAKTLTRHVSADHGQEFGTDVDAKMHLTRACDGPVARSIAPVLTDEERAQPIPDGPVFEVAPPKKR